MNENAKLVMYVALAITMMIIVSLVLYFILRNQGGSTECPRHLISANDQCYPFSKYNEMKEKLNKSLCNGTLCTPSTIVHTNRIDSNMSVDYSKLPIGDYVEMEDDFIYVTTNYPNTYQSVDRDSPIHTFQIRLNIKIANSKVQTRWRMPSSQMFTEWISE